MDNETERYRDTTDGLYRPNDVRINIQSFWGLLAVLLKLTSKSMHSLFRSQKRTIQN